MKRKPTSSPSMGPEVKATRGSGEIWRFGSPASSMIRMLAEDSSVARRVSSMRMRIER